MSRPIVERTFDIGSEYVARRELTASGRHFAPGDPFPWRRMMVTPRRLRQLFDAGYLVSAEEYAKSLPADQTDDDQTDDDQTDDDQTDDERDDSDLDVDSLAKLQDIAKAEGAPIKPSKVAQREAIVAHRDSQETSEE